MGPGAAAEAAPAGVSERESRATEPDAQLGRLTVRLPQSTEAGAEAAAESRGLAEMAAHELRRRLVGPVVTAGLVAFGTPWGGAPTASAQEQQLYIAFADFEGAPVTDMTVDDVVVEWDGVACEIVELEPVNWPARVTVYVDNATESQAALPDMRRGAEALPERSSAGHRGGHRDPVGTPAVPGGAYHRPAGSRRRHRRARQRGRRRDLLRRALRGGRGDSRTTANGSTFPPS